MSGWCTVLLIFLTSIDILETEVVLKEPYSTFFYHSHSCNGEPQETVLYLFFSLPPPHPDILETDAGDASSRNCTFCSFLSLSPTPAGVLEAEAVLKEPYCTFFFFFYCYRLLGDRNRPQESCCLDPVFQEYCKWSVVRQQWTMA